MTATPAPYNAIKPTVPTTSATTAIHVTATPTKTDSAANGVLVSTKVDKNNLTEDQLEQFKRAYFGLFDCQSKK